MNIKTSQIEILQKNAENINVYTYNRDDKYVVNDLDTYYFTIGKNNVKVDNNINIIFYEPVCYEDKLLEVFPTMNITKLPKKEYIMQLYFNLVKGLSRKRCKGKIRKGNFIEVFHYGINIKRVDIKNNAIDTTSDIYYTDLNESLAYIVAQLLYEYIEGEPFTLSLNDEQEKQLKQSKYYLSRCYHDIWHLVGEYLTCNNKKIEKRFRSLGFKSLSDVEKKLKRT